MKSLVLNYGQVTDYGLGILAQSLKFNKSIRKIDLTSNKFTDLGVSLLAETLREHHTSVSILKLGGNKLKENSCQSLYQALKDNRCMSELHLDENMIGGQGARYLGMLLL